MRKTEEEIFVASSKGDVKALKSMMVSCAPPDLLIYVNGLDIAKSVVLEGVRIVISREQQPTAIMVTPQK